jgi:two-component system, OmpR family, phosphate regulon sensor histidine kinase PhoR
MKIISSYNRKWLIYILSFFMFFTAVLLISEYRHEKNLRIEALNERLDDYAVFAEKFIVQSQIDRNHDFKELDSLMELISNQSIRLTLINFKGTVVFDSRVQDPARMENHLSRPEIQMAIHKGYGTDIRISGTTKIKYYYYAKRFSDYLVRVSVLYDIDARKLIQPDRIFLFFVLLIFLITSFTVVLITDKFGKSVSTLRDFTLQALANKPIDDKMVFPENELGIIGQDIVEIYQKLNRTKEELISEKAKLIRHLNMLDEGIAIFSKEKKVITSNNHFIQYINHISDVRVFTADEFFRIRDFEPLFRFINRYLNDPQVDLMDAQPIYEVTVNKGGKFFSVRCVVFQDRSFEISVHDITKLTKRKVLKQEITENIAHELKTPVSSIKGFLETIIEGHPDENRTTDYIKRAYSQSCRLADLVHDISLLTKIEEASGLYQVEEVNLHELVLDIAGEIQPQLVSNDIVLDINMPEDLIINGNTGLLYSIFRNLFDNTIAYAGKKLKIRLDNYSKDDGYYYFSYYDTGVGVPEEDLSRLFERFYRVDKGRDRKRGGTGLGLAIVKNAIQFHKGDVSVKNRTGGGLEFLFTLARDVRSTVE